MVRKRWLLALAVVPPNTTTRWAGGEIREQINNEDQKAFDG